MSKDLFRLVEESDHTYEVIPKWLKNRKEPNFKYTEYGTGDTTLLLLHGLFGAMTNWSGTIPYFEKYAKAIAFHFPLLTGNRTEVKIKALAAYTQFFILKKQIKSPLVLCGNSLGGHVALRLALAAPHLVDALVLAGSSGLYEHTVDTLPVRPSKEFIRSQMERVFYDQKFITEEAVSEVHGITSSKIHQLNIIHSARSAKKDFLLDHLAKIKIPVLLVWGENDLVTTMSVAETFHKNLPNSKLVTFDNCGHAPMIERPDRFSAVVNDFLKERNLLK